MLSFGVRCITCAVILLSFIQLQSHAGCHCLIAVLSLFFVTLWYCVKMAKHIVKMISMPGSHVILVFQKLNHIPESLMGQ